MARDGVPPPTAYSRKVNIEIVSDTMCPNAFISMQYLIDAIDEIRVASMLTAPLEFNVLRVPYLLENNYNESVEWHESHLDRMNRISGDFPSGCKGYNNYLQELRLNERAHAVGLPSFSENRICSNTIRSHRLIRWLSIEYGLNVSESVYSILNHGHFVHGQNLNSLNFLVDCCRIYNQQAGSAVIDISACRIYIHSDIGRNDILNVVNILLDMQISSIPVFIINSYWCIEGAVTSNSFMILFRNIERYILQREISGFPTNVKAPWLFKQHLGIVLPGECVENDGNPRCGVSNRTPTLSLDSTGSESEVEDAE